MTNPFRLDRTNRKLLGVCSGLAQTTGVDPIFWRLAFIIGTLCFGVPLLLYPIIALIAE